MNQSFSFLRLPLLGAFLVLCVSLGGLSSAAAQRESNNIQEAMTPEQFKAAGLEKLSPAELENLNKWLQGDREKTAEKAGKREKLHLIVSRVDGEIDQIVSGQIIRLEDGSVWKLSKVTSNITYRGHADHPGVAVFRSVFGWKMRIGNVGEYGVTPVGR